MTRSAAKRANRNARVIARQMTDLIGRQAWNVVSDATTAQRFASQFTWSHFVPRWNLEEVNWPYVAELRNREANVFYDGGLGG